MANFPQTYPDQIVGTLQLTCRSFWTKQISRKVPPNLLPHLHLDSRFQTSALSDTRPARVKTLVQSYHTSCFKMQSQKWSRINIESTLATTGWSFTRIKQPASELLLKCALSGAFPTQVTSTGHLVLGCLNQPSPWLGKFGEAPLIWCGVWLSMTEVVRSGVLKLTVPLYHTSTLRLFSIESLFESVSHTPLPPPFPECGMIFKIPQNASCPLKTPRNTGVIWLCVDSF